MIPRRLAPTAELELSAAPAPVHLTRPIALGAKRIFDVLAVLVLAVPLVLIVPLLVIAIKVDSRGPILFRQRRVGRAGSAFGMFKFRSMHIDAEERLFSDPDLERLYYANGYKLPEKEDPRITRVGRILRKCSLDELPQLWNVLIGDMSLVGPRPVLPREVEEVYAEHAEICLLVRPGLTGLWQVSGRSGIVGAGRVSLDRRYVEEWSFLGDLVILTKTVPAVLTCRGAH